MHAVSTRDGWTSACAARADALRVQRRTARLVPNWLKDPATRTLHLAGTPRQVGDATSQTGALLAEGVRSDRAVGVMFRAVPFDLPDDIVDLSSVARQCFPESTATLRHSACRSERALSTVLRACRRCRLRGEDGAKTADLGAARRGVPTPAAALGVLGLIRGRWRCLPATLADPVSGLAGGIVSAVPVWRCWGPVLSGCGRRRRRGLYRCGRRARRVRGAPDRGCAPARSGHRLPGR